MISGIALADVPSIFACFSPWLALPRRYRLSRRLSVYAIPVTFRRRGPDHICARSHRTPLRVSAPPHLGRSLRSLPKSKPHAPPHIITIRCLQAMQQVSSNPRPSRKLINRLGCMPCRRSHLVRVCCVACGRSVKRRRNTEAGALYIGPTTYHSP